jgi:hypothetical protein
VARAFGSVLAKERTNALTAAGPFSRAGAMADSLTPSSAPREGCGAVKNPCSVVS